MGVQLLQFDPFLDGQHGEEYYTQLEADLYIRGEASIPSSETGTVWPGIGSDSYGSHWSSPRRGRRFLRQRQGRDPSFQKKILEEEEEKKKK